MKLLDIVNAYVAAEEMSGLSWPYDFALALVYVKKQTRDDAVFFIEKEREIIARYAELDGAGNIRMSPGGKFTFKDPADAYKYEQERRELGEADTKIKADQVQCKPPSEMKPAWLEALEPFIDFSGEA